MTPPDLWGWTPKLMDHTDARWLRVEHAPAPRGESMFNIPPVDNVERMDRWANNEVAYRPDVLDYWQSPAETARRGHGDCEDIALLKRSVLLEAGWSEDRIWFLLVFDVLARCDHAVLLVHDQPPDMAPCFRILDCKQALQVALPVGEVLDYVPRRAMQGGDMWSFERKRASIT